MVRSVLFSATIQQSPTVIFSSPTSGTIPPLRQNFSFTPRHVLSSAAVLPADFANLSKTGIHFFWGAPNSCVLRNAATKRIPRGMSGNAGSS